MQDTGRNSRTPRWVALASVSVVGVTIAASSVMPTQALDVTSPPTAEWSQPLSPTADPDSLVPYAPSDVFEYAGVLLVADPAGVDRFDAGTGSPLSSFPAPANVTIADIVVNSAGAVYAVGTLDTGDPQIWVGRYSAAGVLDWSDSYGNVLSLDPPPFGVGDDRGEAITLDGSGGVYVAGLLDRGFLSKVSVRKYSDAAIPSSEWEDEYLADETPSIWDIGASSAGVYIVGGWFEPSSGPYVLRVSPTTGAQQGFTADFTMGQGRSTGVAVTDTAVFVSTQERANTAAGPAYDAQVFKLDSTTLDVVWSNMIGTPAGVLPDLGSADSATDIAVAGTTVYVTGITDDPATGIPLPGLSGSGGFFRQLTDNGANATVDFTYYSTAQGGGIGTDGTAVYLTGSDGIGPETCEVRSSPITAPGTCLLAKVIDTPSGAGGGWPDFDGDGLADRTVFRPEFGGWFADGQATAFLGLDGDVPVPADYDGDDVTERAVFRDGAWFIEGEPTRFLGTATDVPVPGDYDGDGDWEPAAYRDGAWFIEGQATQFLGAATDVPVPGDYDGDGAMEVAVFRPSVGGWYVEGAAPVFYGLGTDVPVPGDYDGDGSTDRAVFRPEFGGWYVDGMATEFIGLSTDVPVSADYDGDGTTERAVFRPEFGGWYVQNAATVFYGLGTDIPLPLPAAVYNTYYSNPLDIRLSGFACDEFQSGSGWVSMLAVILRHDGAGDIPVPVTFGPPGGPLQESTMADLNPGETFGYAYLNWPREGVWPDPTVHVFQDEVYVRAEYQGRVVLEETYTLDDVRSITPVCAVVIDTPGVSG